MECQRQTDRQTEGQADIDTCAATSDAVRKVSAEGVVVVEGFADKLRGMTHYVS